MLNRIIAYLQRAVSPGYSHCLRCEKPWSFVSGHMTRYSESSACFPLCEGCWSQLTPEERLPYYRQLWESWVSRGSEIEWEIIESACLNENSEIHGIICRPCDKEKVIKILSSEENNDATPIM